MILSATFELMFSHKTPINVIVSEYIKISDFLENAHKGYLNAILDKVSKNVRKRLITFAFYVFLAIICFLIFIREIVESLFLIILVAIL